MRIMRLTGLVVFFAAVFLTFVGSNQLITDNTTDEIIRPDGPGVENVSNPDENAAATNLPVNEPSETSNPVERSSRQKSGLFRRNSSEYNVWRDNKGGKWVVETKWDGQRWVTKRVYYPSSKE